MQGLGLPYLFLCTQSLVRSLLPCGHLIHCPDSWLPVQTDLYTSSPLFQPHCSLLSSASWPSLGCLGHVALTLPLMASIHLYSYYWKWCARPAAWASLGAHQDSGPIPDLRNQNLPFNKVPRWFMCLFKFERLCFSSQPNPPQLANTQ